VSYYSGRKVSFIGTEDNLKGTTQWLHINVNNVNIINSNQAE